MLFPRPGPRGLSRQVECGELPTQRASRHVWCWSKDGKKGWWARLWEKTVTADSSSVVLKMLHVPTSWSGIIQDLVLRRRARQSLRRRGGEDEARGSGTITGDPHPGSSAFRSGHLVIVGTVPISPPLSSPALYFISSLRVKVALLTGVAKSYHTDV